MTWIITGIGLLLVAIAVTLIYLFLVETLVNQFFPGVARWMPFQALNAVFLSEEAMDSMPSEFVDPLEPLVGLTVFLGYVLVFSVAAVTLMRRRDV